MSELKEQVRFGRFNLKTNRSGQRRSTLVTLRNDDKIFFGISRCHSKLDKWDKQEGLRRARLRAQIATQMVARSASDNGLTTYGSGLLGYCDVADVKNLIKYFREITDFLPQNKVEETAV